MSEDRRRLVEVALPVPLFQTFVYEVGDGNANAAVVGSRVLVPFRKKAMIGIVAAVDVAAPPRGTIRRIADVPDAEPALNEELVALCRWMAEYYVVPLGIVMRSVLPALLTGAGQPRPAQKTRRVVSIRDDIPTLTQRDKAFARAPQQRALFELLESLGGNSSVEHLLEKMKFSPSVLKALEQRALVTVESEQVDRDPFATRVGRREPRHVPTDAQSAAIQRMKDARDGEVFLLHGVTGSGKTLVYIELLREVVEKRGQTAIVLVPEIALTPQTVDRFRAVFGDEVAVLHSALSDGERYDAWLALKRGTKKIAVGARSAVFAPLANLGAIIVDEEHEGSYKQGETPRYHARETAIVRATNEGAVVVLGSATPSLESWTSARSGKFTLLSLPSRVGGARLPTVEVVDLRKNKSELLQYDEYRRVVAEPLDGALATRLERGEQSILLLNRRGYSAFVQCEACGDRGDVPQLQHNSDVPQDARAARVSLLHAPGSAAARVQAVRRSDAATTRPRHAAGRAHAVRSFSVRAHRANGRGHDVREMGAHRDPRPSGERRSGHTARHADDRQGTRLCQRHARRRDRRRRRDQSSRLPGE